ncbi:MAG: cysteine dioxygenase [Betaproteobacteria bacterium]|nr:cysteine dioxygenase [Betaproteobacteria bacterium]
MDATTRHRLRQQAIAETVAQVRGIEAAQGVTRESLAAIRAALQALAARSELFPLEDFPMPAAGSARNNALYRLSEDPDHRFALYGHVSRGGTDTPAHNHTTWAVIVGLQGEELNRLYDHDGRGGVALRETFTVGPGTGIGFLPDDLHSIHMAPERPVLNFHMYGLALEQLHARRYYKPHLHEWAHFPASEAIRDLPVAA